ncbi:PLP-dependent aminotransferase family protein [Ruminococcaceae bacterium OttesenSCG-928-O06]|nr:PLP-dependent aminotransferase family protein [Ruminococcaceae bacterium OttesenSCG-928-O06]
MIQYEYSDKVNAMKPSIIRELLKQMADPTLISFAGGNPSAEAFPAEEIRKISDELLRDEAAATLQYSITEGYPPLRALGREYLNRQFAVTKDYDDVIITSGSQQAMDILSKLLCNDGDVVATEDPAFLGAMNCFRSNGAQLVGVQMEADGPNLASLEAALTGDKKPKLFYTIPNFQNPTGYTTSLAKRKAIYELCKKHGVPILEDNPYGELRFTGEDIPPIKSFDEEGLVIYAVSLSKVFAPGLRVALCCGEAGLLGKMTVAKQGIDVHTTLWSQRVIAKFFEQYDFDALLQKLRGVYRAKARRMMDNMDAKLDGRITYVPVEGGMFLWPTLPDGVDVQAFIKNCLDHKLALVPGNAFFVDGNAPCQSMRMNFSTPTNEQIDEGVSIMAKVLKSML